jgi:hypothetical protein
LPRFTVSLVVPAAIILPFFLASPSQFFYDIVTFQFTRPLHAEGIYGLYGVLGTFLNFQLSTLPRLAIFAAFFVAAAYLYREKSQLFLLSAGLLLFSAAFVLPVDGMWNYFLPTFALLCLLAPIIGDQVDKRARQIKWWPRIFDEDWSLKQKSAKMQSKI